MESREQTIRPARRVGTFTFGVTLVVFGLWMLASLLLPEADLLWCLKLSPLVLVLLGGEVLLAARNSGAVRYDWVGMLLCTVIVLTSLSLFAAAWWVTRDPEGIFSARDSGTGPVTEYSLPRDSAFPEPAGAGPEAERCAVLTPAEADF